MIPLSWKRARTSAPTASLTRGIAAVLATGLTAGLAVVGIASPATAATTSYTSGSFTVGDSGPSNPNPVTVTVPAGTGSLESLSLTLINPQHAHDSDMVFDLRSPSGVQVRIGCNDGQTAFSDAQTCQPLTPFYGTDPAGVWALFPNDTIGYGDDPNTSYGGFTLTLETGTAPAITASPEDVTTASGTAVTLTSGATGDPAPAVQWQVDSGSGFVDLPGASTSADYTFTPMFADSGNRYQAVYSNSSGSVTSEASTLTVLALTPSITAHPSDTTADSGSTVEFFSDATGDPVPSIQWERAAAGSSTYVPVTGATAETLTLSVVTFADDGAQYRAVYTNVDGTVVTDPATLTVNLLAPTVTQNPSDAAVASGDDVSFEAAADSEVPQTVQWQRAAAGEPFTDLPGETSTTLAFTASFDQNGDTFRAVFTNPAGSTTTSAATLTVSPEAPQVATDSTDVTVVAGESASFSASVSGDPTPTVQWRLSTDGGVTFTDIDGATDVTYTVTTTAADDGNQYLAVFDNAGGTDTTSAATLTVQALAPSITLHPSDTTADSGATAEFFSDATGDPVPTVQWEQAAPGTSTFVPVPGATAKTLTLSAVTFADHGTQYRAVYTNAGGEVATNPATLTVNLFAPTVTQNPSDTTVASGEDASFVAAADSEVPQTVQWQRAAPDAAFTDLPGETSTTLTFTTSFDQNGDTYRAVFTNPAGSTTTTSATLTVTPQAPQVTSDPTDVTVVAGESASFSATVTGDPTPTVQWRLSTDGGATFTDIEGATDETYTVTTTAADSGSQYLAVFTNVGGTDATSIATLTVQALAPSITLHPSDTTADSGATAEFFSDATGDPVPTVQWERAAPWTSTFLPVPGATAKTLTLSAVTFADHGAQYRAVYTNAGGEVATDPASLLVNLFAPTVTQNPSDTTVASGEDASFVAAADSEVPQTVQWQRAAPDAAFTDLPGETSTTLTVTTSFAQNGDTYRAVFTNPAGSTTTSAATLTVTPESSQVDTGPTDATVVEGESVSFSASATGDPTPTIQWRLSTDGGATFTDIEGATEETYTFTTTAGDDGNQYLAVFDNAGGTDTTNAATLTVNIVPVVTQSPAAQTVAVNTEATFTSAASGRPAPSVQWQVSTDAGATFSDIAGATAPTLAVLAEASTTGNHYRAVYTNAGGMSVTSSATLTVLMPAPAAASPAVASPAPLAVTATDSAPLAVTGADSWILALAAALMVTAGASAVVTRRRMRTTS